MATASEVSGFRLRLRRGEPLFGALLSLPDPSVARILGRSGFDFVVADAEHGAFTLASLSACVDALEASPAAAIVRVAANEPVLIKQALDLGIDAVQVPNVSTAADAAAAVSAGRLPPEGTRGVGLGRASGYGVDMAEFLREANSRTAVLVMIEETVGVANAAEIAAVPGLDGIVIGKFDLSASLGVAGELAHPSVADAVSRIVAAARDADIPVGTACDAAEAPALVADGFRILTTFIDGVALGASARVSLQTAQGGAA